MAPAKTYKNREPNYWRAMRVNEDRKWLEKLILYVDVQCIFMFMVPVYRALNMRLSIWLSGYSAVGIAVHTGSNITFQLGRNITLQTGRNITLQIGRNITLQTGSNITLPTIKNITLPKGRDNTFQTGKYISL